MKGEFDPVDGKEVFVLSKNLLEATKANIQSLNNNYSASAQPWQVVYL